MVASSWIEGSRDIALTSIAAVFMEEHALMLRRNIYVALHNEMRYKSGAPGPQMPSNHLPGRLIEVRP